MLADSGFFTVGQRGEHWWLLTPEGEPFFSLGMNHIDSATLRTLESLPIWRERYGNDQRRWLEERVAPDLVDWGFNTVGWTQEVVVRGETFHRHSRRFTYDEYQWLGLPYCHMLPFAEIHQWELETRYPDVFGSGFEDWCDYVARDDCARMAGDPKLVGYFYSDCPTWVHSQVKPCDKGPWFEPVRLESAAGRQKLFEMASRYYQVTHDAIRRYDPHHLILGDRYEAKARLPDEVVQAAKPFVDVLSFQYFASESEVVPDLQRWHDLTGLPVLLADACAPERDPARYEPMLRALRELPCCVGWHLCGAYLQNRTRGHGLRNEDDTPNQPLIDTIRQANHDTQTWVRERAEDSRG